MIARLLPKKTCPPGRAGTFIAWARCVEGEIVNHAGGMPHHDQLYRCTLMTCPVTVLIFTSHLTPL